jgi:hypothetical protein
MNDFIARIGTFFFLLGFVLFVLFLASDMAERPQFDYFCLSMLAIGLGWMLSRRRAPPPSAGRFSWVKQTRERMRRRRQEPDRQPEKKSGESQPQDQK